MYIHAGTDHNDANLDPEDDLGGGVSNGVQTFGNFSIINFNKVQSLKLGLMTNKIIPPESFLNERLQKVGLKMILFGQIHIF